MDRGTLLVKCEVPAGYGRDPAGRGRPERSKRRSCPLVGIFPTEASREWDGSGTMGNMGTSDREPGGGIPPRAFRNLILEWYRTGRRDLPWRADRDPYRVWVSEVMLQQTRVEAVTPRYAAFLGRFPTLGDLARASEEDVLAAWSGLGYYRRARHLHAAAGRILLEHGGVFPRERSDALRLPGVGVYIAHAVLSIAYGIPLAVVDGNVVRVLSRLEGVAARSPSVYQEEADRLLDPDDPGDANQALMELGATVCTPVGARCDRCPIATLCFARTTGRVDEFPPPAARAATAVVETSLWLVYDRRARIRLERREDAPLRGMWMPPWREGSPSDVGTGPLRGGRELGVVHHAIMNRRYRCTVVEVHGSAQDLAVGADPDARWVRREEIAGLPHSSLLQKALALREESRRSPKGASTDRKSRRDPRTKPRS
jgi:A/G-specific adenine glycosylase